MEFQNCLDLARNSILYSLSAGFTAIIFGIPDFTSGYF
jgi:hypothetical protein